MQPIVGGDDSLPSDQTFANTIHQAPQFTLIGDTWHPDISIKQFVSRETTLAAMQSQGIKHLFLELPPIVNPAIKKLAEVDFKNPAAVAREREKFIDFISHHYMPNFLRGDDRKNSYEIVADTIVNAARHGIAVHGADNDTTFNGPLVDLAAQEPDKFPSAQPYMTAYRSALQIFKSQNAAIIKENSDIVPNPVETGFKYTFESEYFSDHGQEAQAVENEKSQHRLDHDKVVVADIKKITGRQKGAILYGIAHYNHGIGYGASSTGPGMVELLGGALKLGL